MMFREEDEVEQPDLEWDREEEEAKNLVNLVTLVNTEILVKLVIVMKLVKSEGGNLEEGEREKEFPRNFLLPP